MKDVTGKGEARICLWAFRARQLAANRWDNNDDSVPGSAAAATVNDFCALLA